MPAAGIRAMPAGISTVTTAVSQNSGWAGLAIHKNRDDNFTAEQPFVLGGLLEAQERIGQPAGL